MSDQLQIPRFNAQERIARLRMLMDEEGLDGYIVRSTSNLRWLTGFQEVFDSEQAHTAVITSEHCIIHTDSRYATAMKREAAFEKLWEVHDAPCRVADFIATTLSDCGLSEGRIAIDAQTPLALYRAYVKALPEADLIEREGDIEGLRAIKEPQEIELMKTTQQIASDAFEALLGLLHPGMTESEVSLKLEMQMRRRGASELAFANIVASGPNSANPHSVPGSRELTAGDLVVFDFGARFGGYCSDTTRTVSIGEPTPQQTRIYEAVYDANETVRNTLRAGKTGREMHELAEKVLADHGFAGKMGHSLGHGVGIDIHEMPLLSPRYDKPLVAGNVVTDEPGVYLAGSDGVRIEDCGVVTDSGYEIFNELPHELQVIQ
jgi:Xaa-Pro aminopeptidase